MKRSFDAESKGFTIVELLVVIVVVGVLASISIVAYRGIQARAEKSKTIATARNYVTALSAYKAAHGEYPSRQTICLGQGYTNHAGDSAPDCRWGSGLVSVNPVFNEKLAEIANSNHEITQKSVRSGTAYVVGMYYLNDSLGQLDGELQTSWLVYAVQDKRCGMDVPLLGDTYPEFTSKNNDSVSENWGSGGLCWYPLT